MKPTETEILFAKESTREHISKVSEIITTYCIALQEKAVQHDASKLVDPELEMFAEYTPKLKTSTYGSDEYKKFLKEMGTALDHHYAWNTHHPEHFKNGINGMSLLDLIEMISDWKAATLRHANGDILKSLEINAKRFNIGDQLLEILKNSI